MDGIPIWGMLVAVYGTQEACTPCTVCAHGWLCHKWSYLVKDDCKFRAVPIVAASLRPGSDLAGNMYAHIRM